MFALFVGPSMTEDVPPVDVFEVFHAMLKFVAEEFGPTIK
jgi:hypothetical protein